MYCLEGSLLWEKSGRAFFFEKVLQELQILQQVLQVLQILQVLQVPQVHPQKNSFS